MLCRNNVKRYIDAQWWQMVDFMHEVGQGEYSSTADEFLGDENIHPPTTVLCATYLAALDGYSTWYNGVDIYQKLITFFLACWMSCAVCIGLSVAATAGIAYGYNYQMAEWLTFTRADVTVYMRRGQFYDRPDVQPRYISRRSGDEDEVLKAHEGGDEEYVARERIPPEPKNLPGSWSGVKGAENLVDQIQHFTPEPIHRLIHEDNAIQADMTTEPLPTPRDYYKLTSSPSRLLSKLISITPNAVISTAIWKSGDSKIIMRNFQISTMKDIDPDAYKAYHSDYLDRDELEDIKHHHRDTKEEKNNLLRKQQMNRMRPSLTPDLRIRDYEDGQRSSPSSMVMRHWGPTSTPIFQDYSDEVDEDRIVYKPG